MDQFARVTYSDLYPGIALSFYGSAGRFEHDFVVSPGADPRAIRLEISGARRARIDRRGNLVLSTAVGDVVAQSPEIYQEIAGRRVAVAGRWTLRSPRRPGGSAEAGFEIGRYDRGAALVIDPILSYATYLGGLSSDNGYGIAVDGQGNAYVVGSAFSGDFPLQNPIPNTATSGDAFVTKLSNGGSTLVYSTRLGGSGIDYGYSIAVDANGNAYVSGTTFSTDFPTTPGAFRETAVSTADAWVAKLNATGTALVYSTRIGKFGGGSNEPRYTSVAVDSGGNAYVTGVTDDPDFPTTPGAFSRTLGTGPFNGGYNTDAFVTKLNPDGQRARLLDVPRRHRRRRRLRHPGRRRGLRLRHGHRGHERVQPERLPDDAQRVPAGFGAQRERELRREVQARRERPRVRDARGRNDRPEPGLRHRDR